MVKKTYTYKKKEKPKPKAKPVGSHKMPDGTVMSGKTHSKDSKPVKKETFKFKKKEPTYQNIKNLFKISDFYRPKNMDFKKELFKVMLSEGRLTGKRSNGESITDVSDKPQNLLKKDGTFKLKRTEKEFNELAKRLEEDYEKKNIENILDMNRPTNESASSLYKRASVSYPGRQQTAKEIVNSQIAVIKKHWKHNKAFYD